MPSLEVEIEMVTPTGDNPAGTNAKYYISDHGHIGANGEYYHGFIQRAPNLKLQDTGSGQIEMSGATIVISNEPNNPNHPFGESNYTKILSDNGPYYIGIKYQSVYNLFEGQLFIQTLDSESVRCSIRQIRSGTGVGWSTGGEIQTSGQKIPFYYGTIDKSKAYRDDSEANLFDNISGSAVQTVLYFDNLTSTTPTILVNGNASTWTSTGNVRYSHDQRDDGGNAFSGRIQAYQSTHAYASDTAFQFSGTGMQNPITQVAATGGTTFLDFAEFIVYSASRDGRGVPTITNDYFYMLESGSVDSNKTGTSPTVSFILEEGSVDSFTEFKKICLAVNYQYFILPSQTDGDRELTIIDKAHTPATSSAYYRTVSENDVLNLVIRGPQEINRIIGNFKYFNSFGSAGLNELEGVRVQVLDDTGKNLEFDAAITGIDQASSILDPIVTAMKTFYQKGSINAEINDVHDEWRPGDRVVFNRRDEFVNVDMIIRSIEWNFNDLTTTIEGDATLTPYVQE